MKICNVHAAKVPQILNIFEFIQITMFSPVFIVDVIILDKMTMTGYISITPVT